MTAKIPRARAARMLEQARLHLDRNEAQAALPILEELFEARALSVPALHVALGDAYFQSGREGDALRIYDAGRKAFPKEAELLGRVGAAQLRLGRAEEAVRTLSAAAQKLPKDPNVHNYLGQALLRLGRAAEAEEKLKRAQLLGAGPEVRLYLAFALGRQGRYGDAEALLLALEEAARSPALAAAARMGRADCRLFLGDPKGALELWREVRSEGQLEPEVLGHMAYAAQLCAEPELADALMAERLSRGATSEDRLLFAQIANLRGQPQIALQRLREIPDEVHDAAPGFIFEREATRARALRLLGERDKALQGLEALSRWPEAKSARLGAQVFVDLGHVLADSGELGRAREQFERALALDGNDPEARYGLRRTAAPGGEGSAEEAAKAAMDGLQRRFSAREGEVEQLRQELERLRSEQKSAQDALERARRLAAETARKASEQAAKAAEQARREAERLQGSRVQQELEVREAEVNDKAREELVRALKDRAASCPEPIKSALEVAERTYQKALYTELPAAAVAVLYTGALERALFVFFVERFHEWLRGTGRRRDFLEGAVRERRGKRVDYFDHFVEAFDEERPGRAPGLGEVARVLERRREPYLRSFREFLGRYALPEERWDLIAQFVTWAKVSLRDPVAHGRGTEMGYEELRRFRQGLLFDVGGSGEGLLYSLVKAG